VNSCFVCFRLSKYRKYLQEVTLASAIETAENMPLRRSSRTKAIVITPPADGEITVEDSGDIIVNNIGKGVMSSNSEVEIECGSDVSDTDEESENAKTIKHKSVSEP
jgi:hypothetical protein